MTSHRVATAALLAATVVLAGCGQTPTLLATPTRPDPASTSTVGAEQTGPSAQGTAIVTRVVDGDTLVAGGRTIRVVGIDTPERGQCGYAQATANLKRLTLGETVNLTAPGKRDTDRYGRLLRYVDVGPVDAGLKQITSGYANARYDSRDGYGRHPREDLYVAADQQTTHMCAR